MSFLAPGFVVFAALFVVPIIIHLYGRRRARPKPFAAIELLLRSEKRVARRTKLRQMLLLLLRALAIAAVPLIIARPFFETASDLPASATASQSAVIVLDDSLSMSYVLDGEALFEKARARARAIVNALGADAEAALVLAARGSSAPVAELTSDKPRLLRAIEQARPTFRPTDTSGALKRAAQILQSGAHKERRVYLVSDLAAHGFDNTPPWAAGGPELVPVDVTGGAPLANRAVTDLRVEPAAQLGPRGVRITVEVANFGETAVKELPVTLRIDGKPIAKGLVDVPARERALKRFFHTFARAGESAEPGVHEIVGELSADGLAADDRRFFRVEVRRDLRVLVVDGDPRRARRDDEVFYLETALKPGDSAIEGGSQLDVSVITADELAGRKLGDVDVLFLCNVKAPDPGQLKELVDKGGGLFIALGDNVDTDAWNASMSALLPQPLQAIRAADGEGAERIERPGRDHPVLAPLVAAGGEDPFEATRLSRYALFKPVRDSQSRRVLVRLRSGAPLLTERTFGAGRVMLLATSIDRDWSDLPIQPVFAPLMQLAARHLARAPMQEAEPPLLVGQRHEIELPEAAERAEVTAPSGRTHLYDREHAAGRKALPFADTDEPGVYRVALARTERGPLEARPQASFVVNVDPLESDLARIGKQRLAELAMGGGATSVAKAPRRRVELWHALGAGLLLLLLGEALLLRRK